MSSRYDFGVLFFVWISLWRHLNVVTVWFRRLFFCLNIFVTPPRCRHGMISASFWISLWRHLDVVTVWFRRLFFLFEYLCDAISMSPRYDFGVVVWPFVCDIFVTSPRCHHGMISVSFFLFEYLCDATSMSPRYDFGVLFCLNIFVTPPRCRHGMISVSLFNLFFCLRCRYSTSIRYRHDLFVTNKHRNNAFKFKLKDVESIFITISWRHWINIESSFIWHRPWTLNFSKVALYAVGIDHKDLIEIFWEAVYGEFPDIYDDNYSLTEITSEPTEVLQDEHNIS